jgi:hypothetical protein
MVIDFAAAHRLGDELTHLFRSLGNYASGDEEVDPNDHKLLRADALRRVLEAIYQQRITFRGEERPPSGPVVEARIDVEAVAGYAAAVRAETIESGRATGDVHVKQVERGAEAIGVDTKEIGGRRPEARRS